MAAFKSGHRVTPARSIFSLCTTAVHLISYARSKVRKLVPSREIILCTHYDRSEKHVLRLASDSVWTGLPQAFA